VSLIDIDALLWKEEDEVYAPILKKSLLFQILDLFLSGSEKTWKFFRDHVTPSECGEFEVGVFLSPGK